MDEHIRTLLEKIQPSKEDAKAIVEKFKEIVNANFDNDKKSMEEMGKKISLLKNRLNKLYLDRLYGMITDEFYTV